MQDNKYQMVNICHIVQGCRVRTSLPTARKMNLGQLVRVALSNVKLESDNHAIEFVLVIAYLGWRFEINCPSAFFKILKNHEGDLSQKSPEPNM